MAKKPHFLFVCSGNSARSQMAEGFARYYAAGKMVAESAGIEPKGINPHALWVMNEVSVDISQQSSDDLSGKDLAGFDVVVTLCGDARDRCPPLPSGIRTQHWALTDPAAFRGSVAEIRDVFRLSRNEIERRVKKLLNEELTAE